MIKKDIVETELKCYYQFQIDNNFYYNVLDCKLFAERLKS